MFAFKMHLSSVSIIPYVFKYNSLASFISMPQYLFCSSRRQPGTHFHRQPGNDLDLLYPGDDDNDANSDFDPAHDDDNDDNSSTSSDDSDNISADLSAAPNPAELAGVNEPVNITGVADLTPGVC
jgi:hypothetical protein